MTSKRKRISYKICFSHIYERVLLDLISWAAFDMKLFCLICLWWFDNLHCRVLSGNATMESLLEHCGMDFRVHFYFSEHCIPFPGPVKWILSDQWGFYFLHHFSLRLTSLEVLRWPQTDLRAVSLQTTMQRMLGFDF